MIIIAKQVIPAPPAPEPPRPRRRYSCAVMSAPPAGYFTPSDSESEENDSNFQSEEEEAEGSLQSVPEYEKDACSTHTTPVRISARLEPHYVTRRITHPGYGPAQRPSPMRASEPDAQSPLRRLQSPVGRQQLRSITQEKDPRP
jgi:hypothetical protein